MQIPAEREIAATEVVAMCFTFDSKSLVIVIGEPDWELLFFRCDKGRLESSTRATNPNGTGTVSIVSGPEKYISHEIVFVLLSGGLQSKRCEFIGFGRKSIIKNPSMFWYSMATIRLLQIRKCKLYGCIVAKSR